MRKMATYTICNCKSSCNNLVLYPTKHGHVAKKHLLTLSQPCSALQLINMNPICKFGGNTHPIWDHLIPFHLLHLFPWLAPLGLHLGNSPFPSLSFLFIATFEMGKCEDNCIPTCMFNNKTNMFSHVLDHVLHMNVLRQQDA